MSDETYCAKCRGHGADVHDADCPERTSGYEDCYRDGFRDGRAAERAVWVAREAALCALLADVEPYLSELVEREQQMMGVTLPDTFTILARVRAGAASVVSEEPAPSTEGEQT